MLMRSAALSSEKVRVGIVGVGNCASSFVQGLSYYSDARANEPVPGLMHADIGGYGIRDVEISSAFDVSAAKVGLDVSQAIFAHPNNTDRFSEVKPMGVTVQRGRTLDGLGRYLRDDIDESDEPEADVSEHLERTRTNRMPAALLGPRFDRLMIRCCFCLAHSASPHSIFEFERMRQWRVPGVLDGLSGRDWPFIFGEIFSKVPR